MNRYLIALPHSTGGNPFALWVARMREFTGEFNSIPVAGPCLPVEDDDVRGPITDRGQQLQPTSVEAAAERACDLVRTVYLMGGGGASGSAESGYKDIPEG